MHDSGERTTESQQAADYRAIIESAMDGFWWLDRFGNMLEVNRAYCVMTGYEQSELLAMRVTDLDAVETTEQVAAHMDATSRLGHSRFETKHRRKDGSIFDVEVSAQYIAGAARCFAVFIRDISERKRLESALEHRLVALTQPAAEGTSVEFSDIFNVEQIQAIQDAFSDATGVASLITGLDGQPITEPSNFCRLCGDIIRGSEQGLARCKASDTMLGRFNPAGPTVLPCLSSGLWDASASISAGGIHVANWLIGQVRNEAQDEAAMLAYADEIGVDREEFAAALADVPKMTQEQFGRVAQALFTVAQQLSIIAYQNVQQARFITERDAVQTALRESEAMYRTLTEGMKDVVWTLDPETLRFTYVSPSVERLRGYTPEEVMDEPMDAALTEPQAQDLKQKLRARIDKLADGRITSLDFTTQEVPQPCKDGTLVWTEAITSLHISETTGRVELRGVTRDISERKAAQAEIADRERWLNESQRIARLGHYVYDIRQNQWDGSEMLYEVLCVEPDTKRDFAGWLETVHADDRQMMSSYFAEEVVGKGAPFDKEYRIACSPDGADRWVHGLGRLAFNDDGEPISMFGVIQDITERKLSESYREMAREILQVLNQPLESRATVQAVLGTLRLYTGADAVAVRLKSGDEYPYYAQNGFSDEFVLAENALISLSDDGAVLREGGKPPLICTCGMVISGTCDASHPNVTAAGSFFTNESKAFLGLSAEDDPRSEPRNRCITDGYASIALIPIRVTDGIIGLLQLNDRRRGRFTASSVEILETIASHLGAALTRKNAEERLGEVMADLERSNRELEQFAYIASHDLQEPLRMVSSYTELLRKRYGGQLDADADDFIDFAVAGAARMQRLLEDLLAYSRVGTRGKTPSPVDSGFTVEMALANLGTTIRESDATVTVGELPMVMADESQLMRVFQNLIGNALKFHRSDEPPRVEISAEDIGEEWRFSVTDRGIGIPETGYEQVFEVFRRMVGRDEYPGTGIGLSICRRIVERLGGAIWVECSGENGTTFCFTLPAVMTEGPLQTGH